MKNYVFIFGLIALAGLSSCGVGAAEDVVTDFHKKLDAKEYDYIVENMLDQETVDATGGIEPWYGMFSYIESTWGTAESRDEAFDFSSNTNNGITNVVLNYTVKFKSLTVYERIFLVDRGNGFKITGLYMNESKEGLDAMQ
jgi:hypothetical protein